MAKILLIFCLNLVFICSAMVASAEDNLYCGQIIRFDSRLSIKYDEVVLVFKEMASVQNDTYEYTKQLPNKAVAFKLAKNKLTDKEYIELLEKIIFSLNNDGICINVDSKSHRILSVVTGG